jgi:hypothetical protein
LAIGSASFSLLLIAITWHRSFLFGALINVGILYWAIGL